MRGFAVALADASHIRSIFQSLTMNIILIEDDPRIADFLQRGLRAEGLQVQRAATGPEGLALVLETARQNKAEVLTTVVVLDLMLPGMNGMEICQTLRAQGITFPVLMLTALNTLEERVAGLRMGADDYMCKPFEFEELLARLEALSRRGQGLQSTRPTHLQVADILLDRESMRASRAGEVLNLTARELALLELLMSAPGRLFSRERILSSVWGLNEDPLTNVVDVYIRRLRSKIDEGRAVPLIQTMRGLGYRLEAPNEAQV
jgi:DNA-binding response OmpR family regulator